MSKMPRRNIGRELNIEWNVKAQHALYRDNGTWYHRLTRFPGALFDARGYVLFETEQDYLKCSELHLGKQTSCPKGICSIPGYIRRVEQAVDMAEPQGADRALCITNRIVRDTLLARRVKQLHNNQCQVCKLTLAFFGGATYAEAHHIRPLGSIHCGPDAIDNILCVCPNCHAQLDYGALQLSRASLQTHPEHQVSEVYIAYHNSKIYKGRTREG